MIIIRGFKEEKYARQIEKGIVGFRDVLSALLMPPNTGYSFSDYLEANLIKALTYLNKKTIDDFKTPDFLYSLLSDYYIPYIYISYFHILNANSLEWLNNGFRDDDYYFIALDVEIDKLTQTAIGKELFGARLKYIDNIQSEDQTGYKDYQASIMCAIEGLFPNKTDMKEALNIYSTLSFPLLLREQDSKFTDLENEFRLIAFDCPVYKKHIRTQIKRDISIYGNTGNRYSGILNPGTDYRLKISNSLLMNPYKDLSCVLNEEMGNIGLESYFKQVDIKSIASSYRFIGKKKDCENYIKKYSALNKDRLVNKTVMRFHSWDDAKNAKFSRSKSIVKYD